MQPLTFDSRRSPTRACVHLATALLLGLLAARATAAALPPLADPPTGELRPGKLVWIDLITADAAGARRFYGELLGWSFAELGGGARPYSLAYHGGAPLAGIAERTSAKGAVRQSRWVAYMSVPDVAQAERSVVAKGGRALIPARAVEGRGDMAILADPDGAPFGVVRSASGDPPDFRAEPGEWIWALYQGPDAMRAAAFYQDIGRYEVVADSRLGEAPHFMLVAEGFERASIVEISAERTRLRPDWLYFVRVRDLTASLARAEALGARILVAPSANALDGRLAVIADPGGAPLGLLEWDDERDL